MMTEEVMRSDNGVLTSVQKPLGPGRALLPMLAPSLGVQPVCRSMCPDGLLRVWPAARQMFDASSAATLCGSLGPDGYCAP